MFAAINSFSDRPKYLYHKTEAKNVKNILKSGKIGFDYDDDYNERVSLSEDDNPTIYMRGYRKPVVLVLDSSKIPNVKDVSSEEDGPWWPKEREWNAESVPTDAIVGVTLNERVHPVDVEGVVVNKGVSTRSFPKDKLDDVNLVSEFKRSYYKMGGRRPNVVFSSGGFDDV